MWNSAGVVFTDITADTIVITMIGMVVADGTVIAMAMIMTATGEIIATGIN